MGVGEGRELGVGGSKQPLLGIFGIYSSTGEKFYAKRAAS